MWQDCDRVGAATQFSTMLTHLANKVTGRAKRAPHWQFCFEILPDVSRTFALTIPVLPSELTNSVCCAYLLCRIADTVEDHPGLAEEEKATKYQQLCEVLEDPSRCQALTLFTAGWPENGGEPYYQRLIEETGQVVAAFASLPKHHRQPILRCVRDMVSGMREMTEQAPIEGIVYVCKDLSELERYCHYVAGTVGLMLTQLFDTVIEPAHAFATESRLEQGRRFGLGLQLTNVLKDRAVDYERRTSFLPRDWLDFSGIPPQLTGKMKRFAIERTLAHLDEAHRYTLAIPAKYAGIRLFCLWAMWMSAASLREVAQSIAKVPKISRAEVAEIIAYSRQHVTDDPHLSKQYLTLRQAAANAAADLCEAHETP